LVTLSVIYLKVFCHMVGVKQIGGLKICLGIQAGDIANGEGPVV
jgi:hypothetical protein